MSFWKALIGEEPTLLERWRNYENKGQFGEYLLEYALDSHNLPGRSGVFCNLYLPYRNTTTEVDLLLLHEKGIYVIESKNYDGWIFGREEQNYWTQCLENGRKYHFYNPVRQNRTHIAALSQLLKLPTEAFTSMVVFSDHCILRERPGNTKDSVVLHRGQVLDYLRQDLGQRQVRYSETRMWEINDTLLQYVYADDRTKSDHAEAIRKQVNSEACPKCGRQLVLRKGKYSSFWGCSGYPNCRYTRPLK